MIGSLIGRSERVHIPSRAMRAARPVHRFTPRLESLDGRVLPGGLGGGVFTSGILLAQIDLEDSDHSGHSHRNTDPTLQGGSKPGGVTDGMHISLAGLIDLRPGSKPGGAGDGVV
jgi:hypothetical protein